MFSEETNLDKIKDIAILFLNFEIKDTELSPLFIIHPYFESGYVSISNEIINIMENKENYFLAIKKYKDRIMTCDLYGLYLLIRKSYRFTFFKYTKEYLSLEDYSKLLSDIWTGSENPNNDVNVSLKESSNMFKLADKKKLMTDEEYLYYESLSNEFKIYRGVAVGRNHNGLSWTIDKEKAEWFSNRFNRNQQVGYLREAICKKEDVLAYFNRRGENEIVVDYNFIKKIKD